MTSEIVFDGIEIANERVLPHPVEIVFEAFADPAQLMHWWGPAGFTNELTTFDLRPGGAFNLIMRNSHDQTLDLAKTFHEVVRPERIVLEHHGPMHRFLMIMQYAPVAEGTRLNWHMQFATSDETAEIAPFIHAANEQNFDRLETFLAAPPKEKQS